MVPHVMGLLATMRWSMGGGEEWEVQTDERTVVDYFISYLHYNKEDSSKHLLINPISYTGLLTISAKFKAPGAFRCREWVAEL